MALLGVKVAETERAQNRTSGLTSSLTGLVLKILSVFKELKLNVLFISHSFVPSSCIEHFQCERDAVLDTSQSVHHIEEYQLTLSSSSRTLKSLTKRLKAGAFRGHGPRQHTWEQSGEPSMDAQGLASGKSIKLHEKQSTHGSMLGGPRSSLPSALQSYSPSQHLLNYKCARQPGVIEWYVKHNLLFRSVQ